MSSKHLLLQIFIIICISPCLIFGQDEPTICLDSGACYIGGWYDENIRYAKFEGIRYAQYMRFQSPRPYNDPEGTQCSYTGKIYNFEDRLGSDRVLNRPNFLVLKNAGIGSERFSKKLLWKIFNIYMVVICHKKFFQKRVTKKKNFFS